MVIEYLENGVILAAFDDSGSSLCQGDSGGPAIQLVNGSARVVGVSSFTVNGCTSGGESGFAYVAKTDVLSFIKRFAPSVALR
jgi:secreted trypsin-like serine protease